MKTKNESSVGVKILMVITNLFMVGIGFYMFFDLERVVLLFSAAVIVRGAVSALKYLIMKNTRSVWDLITGAVYIIFGAIILIGGIDARIAGVVAVEMFIAIWAVFAGFSHLFGSFGLMKAGVRNWKWTLIGSLLLIALGGVYIAMIFLGAATIKGMTGIYASIALILGGFTGLSAILSGSGKKAEGN